jgi:predicted transglutaminase-like cysteine proteinase
MRHALLSATIAGLLLAAPLARAAELDAYRFDAAGPLADAEQYPPWTDLITRHRAERSRISACLEERSACPPHLRGYRYLIERAMRYSDRRKLDLVNHFINERRWVTERRDSGQRDRWSTLHAFLRDGGDCEDFAIAKYFMLRDLGFAAAALRIVIAWDYTMNENHAVVAVQLGDRALLLETDNTIRYPREHGDYRFLYAINEDHVWDHVEGRVQVAAR